MGKGAVVSIHEVSPVSVLRKCNELVIYILLYMLENLFYVLVGSSQCAMPSRCL